MGLFERVIDNSGDGYGEEDRRMAGDLRKAPTRRAADRIAMRNGLKNARDAAEWLKGRSGK